jgi:DNA-binding response OmpR family regulator
MDNINILVVEDDKEINMLVTRYLKKEGYNVYSAYDGREALKKFCERQYHSIILDIMLPEIDGIEVMRRIREKSTTPIIILSAKGEEMDKILGLGLGADDYVTKPFSIGELTARVKAHLRRNIYFNKSEEDCEEDILTHGNVKLDLNNYKAIKNGQDIKLTAKEFELIKLFFTEKNRVFTKAQIFNQVWGEDYISDENTVMVHIRRVRAKIEDDPSKPKYIQTVWGIGYKLGEVKHE